MTIGDVCCNVFWDAWAADQQRNVDVSLIATALSRTETVIADVEAVV